MPKDQKRLSLVRDLFFWIGVACAVGSLCLVAFSNHPVISKLEHQSLPLSWLLAGAAIGALLVAERCHAAIPSRHSASPARPVEITPTASQTEAEDPETVGASERGA